MTNFIKRLAPPTAWKVPVIIISGLLVGLLFFVFHISRAHSYLSDEPTPGELPYYGTTVCHLET